MCSGQVKLATSLDIIALTHQALNHSCTDLVSVREGADKSYNFEYLLYQPQFRV